MSVWTTGVLKDGMRVAVLTEPSVNVCSRHNTYAVPAANRTPSTQEPETIKAWQQKFGFKRLNKRQLKQLQASVPPLNYYEESVLLSKQLSKEQTGRRQQGDGARHCADSISTDGQQPTGA